MANFTPVTRALTAPLHNAYPLHLVVSGVSFLGAAVDKLKQTRVSNESGIKHNKFHYLTYALLHNL